MKVRELIRVLSELAPDAEVRAWDADFDEYAPVTGAVYDDDGVSVELMTDED